DFNGALGSAERQPGAVRRPNRGADRRFAGGPLQRLLAVEVPDQTPLPPAECQQVPAARVEGEPGHLLTRVGKNVNGQRRLAHRGADADAAGALALWVVA